MLAAIKRFFAFLESIFLPKKKKTPQEFIVQSVEDIIVLGRYAAELLSNPAFTIAIKNYEDFLTSCWTNSEPMQADERESVWHQKKALVEIKLRLNGMVNNMVMEKERIKQEEKENQDG